MQAIANLCLQPDFLQNPLQIVVAGVFDDDAAAFRRMLEGDARAEVGGEDQTGVASTAAIDRLMRAGMKEVKYLDAIVRNTYLQHTDHLRAWESASTLERPPRRKKPAASSPTAGAAPAAPPASS